jgi:flagellin-like protein
LRDEIMMKIKNIWKNNEAVSPVIAVILMVAITVVLAAVLYVWAAGLATTGGAAPSAFSADVGDPPDKVSTGVDGTRTYSAAATSVSAGWKILGQTSAGTFTPGKEVSPRAYYNGTTAKAFAVKYTNTTGAALKEGLGIDGTYIDEIGATRIFNATINSAFATFDSDGWVEIGLVSPSTGVKSVKTMTVRVYSTGQAFSVSTVTFYVLTPAADTIVTVTAKQGKPGDITKLKFYIKVGSGSWKEITASTSTYTLGTIVLDKATTDTTWDVGETVFLSEGYYISGTTVTSTGELIEESTTSQSIAVKIVSGDYTVFDSSSGTTTVT